MILTFCFSLISEGPKSHLFQIVFDILTLINITFLSPLMILDWRDDFAMLPKFNSSEFSVKENCVQFISPRIASCVTLGKFLDLPKPDYLHM